MRLERKTNYHGKEKRVDAENERKERKREEGEKRALITPLLNN